MSKKKYLDMLSGVFFFLLGAVYFGAAAKLPEPLTKEPLGPAGFPQFLAILLMGLSAFVVIKQCWTNRTMPTHRHHSQGRISRF